MKPWPASSLEVFHVQIQWPPYAMLSQQIRLSGFLLVRGTFIDAKYNEGEMKAFPTNPP
jgi:hypothetical protein